MQLTQPTPSEIVKLGIWIKEVLMRDDGHWEIFFYRGDSLVISDGSKHAVRNLIDGGRE